MRLATFKDPTVQELTDELKRRKSQIEIEVEELQDVAKALAKKLDEKFTKENSRTQEKPLEANPLPFGFEPNQSR